MENLYNTAIRFFELGLKGDKFMNIFRKIKKLIMKEKQKKFMECETLEEFIKEYKMFHKQELALEDGRSYFDVRTSNIDGNLIGESFDNAIRIKALNDNNPQFLKQINEEELRTEILKEYKEDLEKAQKEEQ